MQEENSDVVEVRLAADSKSLEVLLNQEVLHFDRTWLDLKGQVTSDSSLFTYDSKFLLDNYQVKHDPDFLPTFSVLEDPNDPFTQEVIKMCGNDYFCKFDALTTRSLWVGNATKLTHDNHQKLVQVLQPVVSCGWLEPPKNGKKEGTSYLVNSQVKITCNKGYVLWGSSLHTCQQDGKWSGQTNQCVYGKCPVAIALL
ncbi:unnamed protein product [Staurois parvus]|uniref:Sushi domain-containing protein n=1 Tax=Staurois parvus TaxID=386267 RepID=A0ABN9EU87_9NEOB|nr:unnamed protein product [Staurois parvus]